MRGGQVSKKFEKDLKIRLTNNKQYAILNMFPRGNKIKRKR
jgi:hypothetical protein